MIQESLKVDQRKISRINIATKRMDLKYLPQQAATIKKNAN